MLNRCDFIGRLAMDPEKKTTANGKSVCNFRLGVTEKYGQKESTEWVSVVCWEKTADFVSQYLKKGALVFVSGKMATRSWEDKDGNKRYTTEIIGFTVQSLSAGKSDSKPQEPQRQQYDTSSDDVPF